jgi:hypothetical protein
MLYLVLDMKTRVAIAFITATSFLLTGCHQKDANCDSAQVKKQSLERAQVSRSYLVLERNAGQWKSKSILKIRQFQDRQSHFTASGRVEVYGSNRSAPIASVLSEGPLRLEGEILNSLSAMDASHHAAFEDTLDGATFMLPLPEGIEIRDVQSIRWAPNASEQPALASLAAATYDIQGLPIEELTPSRAAADAHGLSSDLSYEPVHWSGDPKNRVNLVILADGYTAQDMDQFRSDTASLVSELIGTHRPYKDYADMINIVRVDTPSQEAGANCEDGKHSIRKNRYHSSITWNELGKAMDQREHWCVLANVFLCLHDVVLLRFAWHRN